MTLKTNGASTGLLASGWRFAQGNNAATPHPSMIARCIYPFTGDESKRLYGDAAKDSVISEYYNTGRRVLRSGVRDLHTSLVYALAETVGSVLRQAEIVAFPSAL